MVEYGWIGDGLVSIVLWTLIALAVMASLLVAPLLAFLPFARSPGLFNVLKISPYRSITSRLLRLIKPSERLLVSILENGGDLYWSTLVASIVVGKGLCYSRVNRLLADNGLYEALISLALRGCNVGYELLREALAFTILSGDQRRSKILESIMGEKLEREGIVYAYCGSGRRAVKIGDALFDTGLLPRQAAARVISVSDSEWLMRLKEAYKPKTVVGWKCESSQDIDALLVARVFFPDVNPDIGSLGYHLEAPLDSPVVVVEKLSRVASWILSRINSERVPGEIAGLLSIPPLELSLEPASTGDSCITITDKPRMSKPLVKPYRVNPGSPPTTLAWVAVHSLRVRSGDPSRAYYYNKDRDQLGDQISRAIIGSLEPGVSSECGQVEPWDVSFINLKGKAIRVDCASITVDCLFIGPGFSRFEIQMVEDGVNLYKEVKRFEGIAIEDPRGVFGYRRGPTPKHVWGDTSLVVGSLSGLSVDPGSSPLPRIYVNRAAGSSRSFWDLLSAALPMISDKGGERPLLLVPYTSLSRASSRTLRAVNLDTSTLEEWVEGGGLAVASIDAVLANPEIIHAATSIVVVSPEGIVRRLLPPTIVESLPLERLLELASVSVKELVAKYSGLASSRALARLGGKDVSVKDYGRAAIKPETIDPSLIVEDIEGEFKKLWGRDKALRRHQRVALSILSRSYAEEFPGVYTIVLPTGSGKSAIFQLLSRWATVAGFGPYSLVVSPLRALMRDQVERSKRRGLVVSKIDSSTTSREKKYIIEAALTGMLELLYVTPERFQDESIEALLGQNPALIVLDEAHTLVSWGNTFRPSYLYAAKRIREKRLAEGWPPVAMFTATGTRDVVEDLFALLGEREYAGVNVMDANTPSVRGYRGVFLEGPIVRDELKFEVVPARRGPDRVEDLLKTVASLARWANSLGEPWVGIVFTGYVRSSRMAWANAEMIAKAIESTLKLRTVYYHGQMPPSMRRAVENKAYSAARGEVDHLVIVATKAFGMGVDIPNVRWVVHYMPSDSPEDFYQEAGRAGRDGKASRIVVLYNPGDIDERRRLSRLSRIKPSTVLKIYNTIVELRRSLRKQGYRDSMIPVPLEALYGRTKALKALDILRRLGFIDYRVTKSRMALYEAHSVPESSRWALKLRAGRLLSHAGISGEEAKLVGEVRVFSCSEEPAEPLKPLKYVVGGEELVSVGKCEGELVEYSESPLALVYMLNSDKGSEKKASYFSQETLFNIIREFSQEEAKLDYLESMLEKALATSIRAGASTPDSIIKSMLELYFREYMFSRRGFQKLPAGVRECRKDECLREILDVASRAIALLGHHYVTISIREERLRRELEETIVSKLGKVNIGRETYRKVRSALRNGSYRLMDLGYIILVASKNSKAAKILTEKAGSYPNLYLLLAS